MDAYLACNGCSAYLAVSKDVDKSKCILQRVFTKLKFKIPTLDKPIGPLSMVKFLEQLIARDFITTVSVSLADHKRIKPKAGSSETTDTTVEPANSTTMDNPPSPAFHSLFDYEAIQETAWLENFKNALDQVITYEPVLEALKHLKLDTQYKLTSSISEDVKVLKHDVKEMKEVQVQQAATLDLLKAGLEAGAASNTKAKKVLCIICSADLHFYMPPYIFW